ncbi:MAG: glycosyltransferase family 4 protein [Anaerolineae bacterium]
MRVCLDLSPVVYQRAGLGTYAHCLAEGLLALEDKPALTAFYNGDAAHPLPPTLASLPTHALPLATRPWRLLAAFSQQLNVGLDRWLPDCDLFHATEHLLPRLKGARTVLTVHDLIFLLFPEYHLPLNKWFLNRFMPLFVRRADAIIAVSQCTKDDLMHYYAVPSEKITVVYEGVDARFQPVTDPDALARMRARYGLPERYVLCVSTIEPRKNLATLLEAYQALREGGSGFKLVIVGRKGWLYEGFFRRLHELGLEGEVVLLGFVPDEDLPALYSAADLFVFPSLYEGFGLPPLEAMACGTPVIASNTSSLPEVVGEAGILIDPHHVGGLVEAMERVLMDEPLRAEMRAKGLERARRFMWGRAAAMTLEVYRSVLGSGSRCRSACCRRATVL